MTMKKFRNKIGITSNEFAKIMETKGRMSDKDIVGMEEEQVHNILRNNPTVAKSARALKRKGMTEFSIGWTVRLLLAANKRMSEMAGLLDKLAGGLSQREVGQINQTVKKRSKDNLRYIA